MQPEKNPKHLHKRLEKIWKEDDPFASDSKKPRFDPLQLNNNPIISDRVVAVWKKKNDGGRGEKIKLRLITDENLIGGTKRRGFFELVQSNDKIEEYLVYGSSEGLGTLAFSEVCKSLNKNCLTINQHPKKEINHLKEFG
jgi:hypothetical protein